MGFYAQRFAGAIASRIRLNDEGATVLSGRLTSTAISLVLVLFYALAMAQYDLLLTAIAVGFVFYRPLPTTTLNVLSLLRFAFRGQGRDWLMIGLTGVAATLIGMVVPQATAVLVDTVVPYGDRALLWQIGLGLLAVALGAASFQLAQAIATLRVETGADAHLQAAVWDRLLTLKTSFFRQYPTGDLASRVSSISTIRRKLSGSALQGIFAGSFSLLNLGLLVYYSPTLAGVALLVALGIVAVTVASGLVLVRRYRPLLEIQGQL